MNNNPPVVVSEDRAERLKERPPRGRLRAAQREFTRSKLIEAGIEVFAQRGYARATIDEIAERAGATRATFYLHFKSKSDLLPELMMRSAVHYQRIFHELSPVVHEPTWESVRGWLAYAMGEWDAIRDLAAPVRAASVIEPEIHDLLMESEAQSVQELADALTAGSTPWGPADAYVFASILLAPLNHYFQLFLRGVDFDRKRVLDAMAQAWMAIISGAQATRTPSRRAR